MTQLNMFVIYSSQKDNYIKFYEKERQQEHYPSIKFEIDLHLQFVSGEKMEAHKMSTWIDLEILKKFRHDLQELYATNQGISSLESLSPREFNLEIKTIDNLGHLRLRVEILKKRLSNTNTSTEYGLKGDFEIELASVGELINHLKPLIE